MLMRQSIEDNNGFVFKTIGDAFCAAFATAPDAVNAALFAQQALSEECHKRRVAPSSDGASYRSGTISGTTTISGSRSTGWLGCLVPDMAGRCFFPM